MPTMQPAAPTGRTYLGPRYHSAAFTDTWQQAGGFLSSRCDCGKSSDIKHTEKVKYVTTCVDSAIKGSIRGKRLSFWVLRVIVALICPAGNHFGLNSSAGLRPLNLLQVRPRVMRMCLRRVWLMDTSVSSHFPAPNAHVESSDGGVLMVREALLSQR